MPYYPSALLEIRVGVAVHNEILVGRFNRMLQKLTGVKASAPVKQLAGEMMATITMGEGDRCEHRIHQSIDMWSVSRNLTGGVANAGGIRMRNPNNSKMLAVIERAVFANTTGANQNFKVLHGVSALDLATIPLASERMDARTVRTSSTLIQSEQNATPGVFGQQIFYGNASISGTAQVEVVLYESEEIPVLPGDAVQFQSDTANATFGISVRWRERLLEPSELAGTPITILD